MGFLGNADFGQSFVDVINVLDRTATTSVLTLVDSSFRLLKFCCPCGADRLPCSVIFGVHCSSGGVNFWHRVTNTLDEIVGIINSVGQQISSDALDSAKSTVQSLQNQARDIRSQAERIDKLR